MELGLFLGTIGIFIGSLFYPAIVLVVGIFAIKAAMKIVDKTFKSSNVDATIVKFLEPLINASLKVVLGVTVLTMLGVEMATFVAIIAAASFAVGMALQGSLANFAGGVIILMQKPFIIGDYIEASGHNGVVDRISIFYTYINTLDNKNVMIPNGALSNHSITNYSTHDLRRVDFVFGVGYESNTDTVKAAIMKQIDACDLVLKNDDTKAPFVRMSAHGDSALEFTVRVWCESANYWDVYFNLMENVKAEFDAQSINIPYPHVQVVKA